MESPKYRTSHIPVEEPLKKVENWILSQLKSGWSSNNDCQADSFGSLGNQFGDPTVLKGRRPPSPT